MPVRKYYMSMRWRRSLTVEGACDEGAGWFSASGRWMLRSNRDSVRGYDGCRASSDPEQLGGRVGRALGIVRDFRCFGPSESCTHTIVANVEFKGEVEAAEVFISGFNMWYTDGRDHGLVSSGWTPSWMGLAQYGTRAARPQDIDAMRGSRGPSRRPWHLS